MGKGCEGVPSKVPTWQLSHSMPLSGALEWGHGSSPVAPSALSVTGLGLTPLKVVVCLGSCRSGQDVGVSADYRVREDGKK